jgi:hypothetical protein
MPRFYLKAFGKAIGAVGWRIVAIGSAISVVYLIAAWVSDQPWWIALCLFFATVAAASFYGFRQTYEDNIKFAKLIVERSTRREITRALTDYVVEGNRILGSSYIHPRSRLVEMLAAQRMEELGLQYRRTPPVPEIDRMGRDIREAEATLRKRLQEDAPEKLALIESDAGSPAWDREAREIDNERKLLEWRVRKAEKVLTDLM